ncbi:MAG TPA: ribonuclease Z [Pyrinomonadaceae bacterium]|nr:ribonuclease Z [Pyrinomonadaceae bacterium]
MKLVVLGSGTSVPHPRRASAGYWLETQSGTLLLDAGADAPHRMAQEELDWGNLDAIWISHFHLDHIGGLAPFLFSVRWAPQTRARRKPLKIFGPQGLELLIKTISNANNYKLLEQSFPVELIEVESGKEFLILPGLRASTLSTPHTPESMAIRLTGTNGKSLVYSSDTGFSELLADFAREVELLILECSFRRNKPVEMHLELSDAMQLIGDCRPRTALLTHLYPEWDNVNVSGEAQALWPGRTIEAVDGLRLEV